jgi:hypothetical protein
MAFSFKGEKMVSDTGSGEQGDNMMDAVDVDEEQVALRVVLDAARDLQEAVDAFVGAEHDSGELGKVDFTKLIEDLRRGTREKPGTSLEKVSPEWLLGVTQRGVIYRNEQAEENKLRELWGLVGCMMGEEGGGVFVVGHSLATAACKHLLTSSVMGAPARGERSSGLGGLQELLGGFSPAAAKRRAGTMTMSSQELTWLLSFTLNKQEPIMSEFKDAMRANLVTRSMEVIIENMSNSLGIEEVPADVAEKVKNMLEGLGEDCDLVLQLWEMRKILVRYKNKEAGESETASEPGDSDVTDAPSTMESIGKLGDAVEELVARELSDSDRDGVISELACLDLKTLTLAVSESFRRRVRDSSPEVQWRSGLIVVGATPIGNGELLAISNIQGETAAVARALIQAQHELGAHLSR